MYVPANHTRHELELELGEAHMLYEWRDDVLLRQRWPTQSECRQKGWNQKERVALYHWVMLTAKEQRDAVHIQISESWKHPACPCWPDAPFRRSIVVFRVNLRERMSQYLGWLTPDDFRRINVVNWSFKPQEHKVLRRVILLQHLRMGIPQGVEYQQPLFEE